MRSAARLAIVGLSLMAPCVAHADGERALATLEAVRDACRIAEARPARELLAVEVEPGWTFGALTEEGFLAIEPRRNFRALNGRLELFSARMEPLGVIATPERAAALETARQRGATLRIGFFLGMDEPDRTACVIRSRHATSTVRMDVAFVEVLGEGGAVLAREDTERYRAWRDDQDREAIPGEGPRAAIGAPTTPSGGVPESWERALVAAGSGEVGRTLGGCHRAGVARGAETIGRVVVRARVDARSGRVVESQSAISDLGDAEEATCVADAMRGITLPPTGEARVVELDVPVRFTAE